MRALFEGLKQKGKESVRVAEAVELNLRWSLRERERFTIALKKRSVRATSLQHWFFSFAQTRNSIIHQGVVPALIYRQPRSRYNGHYVWTAEWLLRVAILIAMDKLGLEDLWRSEVYRIVKRTWAEAKAN